MLTRYHRAVAAAYQLTKLDDLWRSIFAFGDISCDDDLHATFTLRLVLSSHDLDRVAVRNRLRFSSALADASRDENVLAHLREEKRRAWLCGLDQIDLQNVFEEIFLTRFS